MSVTTAPLHAPAAAPPLAERLADWTAAEWDRWPLWLPVALGAGVVTYFALRWEPGDAWFALPLAPILATLPLWRLARPAAVLALMLAAAAVGFVTGMAHARLAPPVPDLPRTAVVVTGTVSNVELLPEGRRITLEGARWPDAAPLSRDIRIRLRADDPARPAPGDTLSIRALIRAPSAPSYPGAWDFQRAAYFSGLAGSGFALGAASVTPADETPLFAGLRAAIEARVREAIPSAAGAISAALLTGSQSGIPAETMTAMRDSGLAHLLSVSGLHAAIVIGLGYLTARWLLGTVPWIAVRMDGKPAAAVAGLLLGGAYTVLTGTQVPMVRSFAMAALATLALLTGRRVLSPRALALAAGVVLLAAPAALLGPSFQMSFAAVLALIAAAEAMRIPAAALRERGRAGRIALLILGTTVTSIVAAAATTPFGLHHFGRLQIYGVAANAVAVPLTSFIVMPAGMLALC
ncbi:ComEC/Rec2 family competence protein [Roseomonas sp. CCTCC AB2023176]|uniref:ComEC/Rec2 family competence protein n=1 Tax=Roseomonas sp. CCTCC AB2023176 TaxID=3342640 RepID=UPI0035E239B5